MLCGSLQRARRLFARVLEAPGGLKIQTIHSFAQSLLAAFPALAAILSLYGLLVSPEQAASQVNATIGMMKR